MIHGDFWRVRGTRAALADAVQPYVDAELSLFGRRGDVRWAIDTGSPYTVLHPEYSYRLLGELLSDLDFETHPQRFDIVGVGAGRTRTIITPATLTFEDDSGELESINMPVLIAGPTTPFRSHQGNWQMPSLLGCDILRYFDLALSYNPPSMRLTEAEPA